MPQLRHVRARWPETKIPSQEPEWLLYELDEEADNVLRTVEVFSNGTIRRNSVEIEERDGSPCQSLVDVSIAEGFAGVRLEEIEPDTFEQAWANGIDTPFWNVRTRC